MAKVSIKAGDSLLVEGWNGDIVLSFDRIAAGRADLTADTPESVTVRRGASPERDIRSDLKELADEIGALLSQADAGESQALLTQLVSDLFYAQAQRRQREERRARQAAGIAAAKARGVRFGAEPKPLPKGFDACYEALLEGRLTATEAAKACGISRQEFYRAMERKRKMAAG